MASNNPAFGLGLRDFIAQVHRCCLAHVNCLAALEGAALAWDAGMQAFYPFLGLQSNPIPVKALLQGLGYGAGLRLPLLPLAGEYLQQADLLLKAIPALEAQSARESIAA